MTWLQRYRIRHYITNSIWIWPLLSMVAAIGVVRFLHWIDESMGWESSFHPDTARAVLGTMAASMFTFIVFVSSALLVSVQLASSQLTPRIIAIVFRDPVTRSSLAVFVFAFTFSLAALVRITASVPPITATLGAYSGLASLVVFLYLIDHGAGRCGRAGPCGLSPRWDVRSSKTSIRGALRSPRRRSQARPMSLAGSRRTRS